MSGRWFTRNRATTDASGGPATAVLEQLDGRGRAVAWHLDWDEPPASTLGVIGAATVTELSEAVNGLGRPAADQFFSAYDVVWGVRPAGSRSGAVIDDALSALADAGVPIDLIVIGAEPPEIDEAAQTRRLVLVDSPDSDRTGDDRWVQVHRVRPVDPGDTTLPNSSELPVPRADRAGVAVLQARPVVRTIADWLRPGPTGGSDRSPWLDRSFLVVPVHLTVGAAADAAEQAGRHWVVVGVDHSGGDRRYMTVTTAELRAFVERYGPAGVLLHQPVGPSLPPLHIGSAPAVMELLTDRASLPGARTRVVVDRDGWPTGVLSHYVETTQTQKVWLSSGSPQRPSPDGSGAGAAPGYTPAGQPAGPPPPGDPPPMRTTEPPPSTERDRDRGQGATIARMLQARGPRTLAVDQTAEIELSISDRGVRLAGASVSTFAADPIQPLQLVTRSTGCVELIEHRPWLFPADADQAIAVPVRGASPGDGSVVATIWQGSDELASIELAIQVGPAKGGPPQVATATVGPSAAPRMGPQLRLYRQGQTELRCELNLPGQGLFRHTSIRLDTTSLDLAMTTIGQVDDLRPLLQGQGEVFDERLFNIGSTLTKKLFPSTIIEALWEARRDLDGLELVSDVPAIPWELCAFQSPDGDRDPDHRFLGQGGLIRRWYGETKGRGLHDRRRLRARPGRRLVVAPTYEGTALRPLPAGKLEAEVLRDRFGARWVGEGESIGLTTLFEPLRNDYDLFHFTGHGWTDSEDPTRTFLLLDDVIVGNGKPQSGLDPIAIPDVPTSRQGSIVFLNACHVGRLGPDLGGFAQAFFQAGASALIGGQWAISDAPARQFAEAFYDHLLSGEPSATLASAAKAARAAPLGPGWNANFLGYVVYGNPEARVVTD
ncbi:MAG: CHAT domain-containing protein [Actinomycetota bacterium]